jgi:hypothetical protein
LQDFIDEGWKVAWPKFYPDGPERLCVRPEMTPITVARKKNRRKAGQRARQAARRRDAEPQTEAVDRRRAVVVDVTARDGVPLDEAEIAVLIEPVRLPSGQALWFQAPFVVPFYLLKSKSLRDVAEPKRERAVTETVEAQMVTSVRATRSTFSTH